MTQSYSVVDVGPHEGITGMFNGWPNRLSYSAIPFHEILDRSCAIESEKVILAFEGRNFTLAHLEAASHFLAHGLNELGVRPGDRVMLHLSNSVEWIVSVVALSRIGAAVVLLNPAWQRAEVEHAIALTGPTTVICESANEAVVGGIAAPLQRISVQANSTDFVDFASLLKGSEAQKFKSPDIDLMRQEFLLPFSSGTTGMPKAVRHTHFSVYIAIRQWMSVLNLTSNDAIQNYSPLAHILGVVNIGASLHARAFMRLFRRFHLEEYLQSIQDDQITIGVAVAPVALAMANHPDLEQYDMSSVRFFNWAATPLNVAIANRFTDRTGVRWMQAYGTSECPVLFANPVHYPERWRLDSAGLPVVDVEAKVVDVVDQNDVAFGESGEIVVRSPNRMSGYIPDSANELAWLPGGWYRTGDVGWMEPEGWLHITDRLKEMIKSSGFQIAPAEIEAVLFSHEDVVDCAVFSIPDPVKNELPAAVVKIREGASFDAEKLLAWVSSQLAPYKRLAFLEQVDEIPKTASGKTLRRQLSHDYAARNL